MGASCTTLKTEKVVRPLRTNPNDPAHLESLPSGLQRPGATSKSTSRKSRKRSEDASISLAVNTYNSSRNRIGSTNDVIEEESIKPTSLNIVTTDNNTNSSQIQEESMSKKSAHYKKGPLIGTGSNGEVYECLNLETGELVAVKEIKFYGDAHTLNIYAAALRKENALFRTLSHPNIMKYYEMELTEVPDQNYMLIGVALEYVSGGSIKALLDKFHNLEEKVVVNYTRQMLEGLTYLHQVGIVHRNLKGTNILIDASGTIKLSDFGSFKFDRLSDENSQDDHKTPAYGKNALYWLAPEVVMKKAFGKPADIWSIGCVALEMLTGTPPWQCLATNTEEICRLINSGTPPPFPANISEQCRDFLCKTFKFKPEDRPTAADLLEHPFIKDMSPNNSYLESETTQTVQTSSMYGRQGDYVKNSSNFEKNFSLRSQESRLNNLGPTRSILHLNASRHTSNRPTSDLILNPAMRRMTATELIPLSRSDVHDKDIDQNNLKNSLKMSTLLKVQEVSGEDEYTPSVTEKPFFPSRPRQVASSQEEKISEQEAERIKAERRRQLEEQMMRELAADDTDHIKEACEEEEDEDESETLRAPITESKEIDKKSSRGGEYKCIVVPIRNSLFNDLPGIEIGDAADSNQDNNRDFEASMTEKRRDLDDDAELNLKSGNLGVFWTWAGDVEKSGEIDSGKIKTQDNISERDQDKQVAIIGNSFSEMWNEEPEASLNTRRASSRLARPSYDRIKQARRRTEQGLRHEMLEASPSNLFFGDASHNDNDFHTAINNDLNIIEEL